MSKLHVNHLKAKLTEKYSDKIDVSDARSEEERENFLLTRAYAAYTLQVLAMLDVTVAATTITDGFDDNGMALTTTELTHYILTDEIRNCGFYNLSGLKMAQVSQRLVKQQNFKMVF
jgi:hypothetical protein